MSCFLYDSMNVDASVDACHVKFGDSTNGQPSTVSRRVAGYSSTLMTCQSDLTDRAAAAATVCDLWQLMDLMMVLKIDSARQHLAVLSDQESRPEAPRRHASLSVFKHCLTTSELPAHSNFILKQDIFRVLSVLNCSTYSDPHYSLAALRAKNRTPVLTDLGPVQPPALIISVKHPHLHCKQCIFTHHVSLLWCYHASVNQRWPLTMAYHAIARFNHHVVDEPAS